MSEEGILKNTALRICYCLEALEWHCEQEETLPVSAQSADLHGDIEAVFRHLGFPLQKNGFDTTHQEQTSGNKGTAWPNPAAPKSWCMVHGEPDGHLLLTVLVFNGAKQNAWTGEGAMDSNPT